MSGDNRRNQRPLAGLARVPIFTAVFVMIAIPFAAGAPARHPLDALDAAEITAAGSLLRSAGHADDHTLFAAIALLEPTKASVLSWKAGDAIPRKAQAVFRRNGKTFEAVIDLQRARVVSVTEIPGAQPFITMPEILEAIRVVVSHPRMQEGLRLRGITDFKKLFCAPRTVGNFGGEEENRSRIVKVDCFDTRDVKTDVFAKPIEGLFATVDLDRKAVLQVTDLGVVPIPGGEFELDPASIGTQRSVKPVVPASPQGSNITIDGAHVRWQTWSFHLRWDIRAGAVVSMAGYDAGDGPRSILYQGSLAEIFVPYQDPTEGWYYRTYMDEGEYGFGTMASELVPGADCPKSAVYLSPVMSNAAGGADTLKNRMCLFERPLGEPVWRHYDLITEALESRPALELVVRYIATVGNYDYVMDWAFDQKGGITFRGGATGIDSVKGVRARSLSDPTAAEDTAWGPLVSPGRAGINHDHFFSLRLDLDIEGPANTFVLDRLVTEKRLAKSKRRSLWRVRQEKAKTDTDAKFRLNYERPALWRVINPHKTNALGYPVSYAIRAQGNALPLVDPADPPLGRAGFANYHLWVTPYDPKERFAAGEYPNQSKPGEQGLPAWTAKKRPVEDRDIVLWYTLGFHHIPSAEDWPVYNLGWHSVTLRPYNFFDRNPALDVPPWNP